MKISDRAKQFLPFSALKGFEEIIETKNKLKLSKIELSDCDVEDLNKTFSKIKKNDMVKIVYFYDNDYKLIEGMVSNIDSSMKKIKVIKTEINFGDIYSINIIK